MFYATSLAMAGMADAAAKMALMVAWCALGVAAIASFLAFAGRSWAPVVVAGVALCLVALLFAPWQGFITS